MDRYLLRYFLAVIDQGNFSRAAQHCNVSQPTLSAGIAKLEGQLGRTLFHRSNKRVELTEAGASLARHARRIEAEFLAAERHVQGLSDVSTLRLGILNSIPGPLIEDYVQRLHQAGTGERVEFVEGRERELLERLSRGRIDAAVTILRGDDRRFTRRSLYSEGYSMAVPAHHPLAHGRMIDGAEFGGDTMIVRRHCELLSETSRYFTARGVRPFFAARTVNDDHAMRLVKAGLGVTVMPDSFRMEGVARPSLADFPYTREIGLLFGSHTNPAALLDRPTLGLLLASAEQWDSASASLTAFMR